MVAGPLAQLRPLDPGCSGFPSNFRTWSVSRSTYARSPHADSQLKQVVGTSMYLFSTRFGHAFESSSTQSFQRSFGGKAARWMRLAPG